MLTLRFSPVILGVCGSLLAAPFEMASTSNSVTLLSNSLSHVELRVSTLAVSSQLAVRNGDTTQLYTLPGEGLVYIPGRPLLPAVSRFVIVPPDKGLELSIQTEEPTVVPAVYPLALCDDAEISSEGFDFSDGGTNIYPANLAIMSAPVVIRGVRLVKITTYPVRFDYHSNSFLIYDHIQAEVRFNDNPPVNPALHPNRQHRSREFLKFLDALVLNHDLPGRDDPSFVSPYVGHYLIVGHERCMQFARPFIEWRRKCGYKVDQLSIGANDALNENTVKNLIQQRYDAYLDQGLDPFDNILLLGDRTHHYTDPPPNWILDAYQSESVWPNDANHADYLYATLEGNDLYPDAAISRFASGGQNLMELAVAKTLSYEATPFMDDTSWFRRGGAFSQHWGNDAQSAWHPSIHTNVRWAEELLKTVGYNDIVAYENFDWDHPGDHVGPEVADLFNAKANMVLGRIQNNYWRWSLQGANVNNVFPFYITESGHGEAALELVFRVGTAQHPMGAVATTAGWGDPPTAPTSALWMDYIKAFLTDRMSFGWARNFAIIDIESIFPNIRCAFGASLYTHVKTDFDFYGDPAIKPWFGAPRLVETKVPARINEDARMVEVSVSTGDNQDPVSNAQVTFYDPGNMPAAPGDYLAYDDMFTMIAQTDIQGKARFIFPEDHSFRNGGSVFVTVTGDDIKPDIHEIPVSGANFDPEISDYQLTENEGNGDGLVNPGETFDLSLTARNNGNGRLDSLTAIISSSSRWIEIIDEGVGFGAIAVGQTREGDASALFRVSADCPDGLLRSDLKSELLINLIYGNNSKESAIRLDPRAPCLSFESLEGGNIYSRGENNLSPIINNLGRIAAEPLTARLISTWQDVQIVQRASSYDGINPNHSGRITGDAFRIQVDSQVVPGTKYKLILALCSQAGFKDTVRFEIQVEQPAANTPTGPDKYGYCCFDDADQGWDAKPSYQWVEINPRDNDFEYEGSALNFNGQSPSNIGEAIVTAIGFSTNFYGLSFDHLTVASNGFIAMGSQPRIVNFQNWPMDKAIGGGMGMLAPLWDDLRLTQNSWIGTYLDEDEHRLIIEWYRMRPANGNADFTFQVILYDTEHHSTHDHNQPILFQYKTVSELPNIREGDVEWVNNIPYASVGISSPIGDTGLNYVWDNAYPVSSAHLQNRRALRFVSLGRQVTTGYLFGRVVNLENDEPLAGASLFTDNGVSVAADDEGYWSMNAPANVQFSLTASFDGFNDSAVTEMSIDENDTLEVNFALTHPQIFLSLDAFGGDINFGEELQIPFTIRNAGNGPLQWHAEKQLAGERRAPWEAVGTLHCGQEVGDSRIEGVVFAGDNFYLSGAKGADPNWIYVLNRHGEQVGGFAQLGNSQYGMKDLDWDGEHIWGSGENSIYSFDFEGNSGDTLPSPVHPCDGLAWDSDRDLLWCCGIATRIYGLDRDGNVVVTLPVDSLRKYGLAYRPDDPDGMGLYLFIKDLADGRKCVWKTDPDEGRFVRVTYLETPAGESSGGAFISHDFDPLHTTFISITATSDQQGGDRIDMYELHENLDWMNLTEEEGALNPGEAGQNSLTLGDGGLPAGNYDGTILIHHNGAGGRVDLPVSLSITEQGVATRRISLQQGWNLISLNIEPEVTDIPQLFRPLVDAGNLLMIKDGAGNYHRPDREFSNLPPWDVAQGYQVAVRDNASLEVRGASVAADTPIPLEAGWNMISYYPRQAVFAEGALANISDRLIIAKDGVGQFYLPEYNFSNMDALSEGSGYLLKVTQSVDLVYRVGNLEALHSTSLSRPTHFTHAGLSGENMSLLIIGDNSYQGKELGAFNADGHPLGAGRFDPCGRCGLAVGGMDSADFSSIGNAEGSAFHLRLWDGFRETDLPASALSSSLTYVTNGIRVIRLDEAVPQELLLEAPFPNPFNSTVLIRYRTTGKEVVLLKIFDLAGREVALLANDEQQAGQHQVVWEAAGQPSGLYFARLKAGGEVRTVKLLLAK